MTHVIVVCLPLPLGPHAAAHVARHETILTVHGDVLLAPPAVALDDALEGHAELRGGGDALVVGAPPLRAEATSHVEGTEGRVDGARAGAQEDALQTRGAGGTRGAGATWGRKSRAEERVSAVSAGVSEW